MSSQSEVSGRSVLFKEQRCVKHKLLEGGSGMNKEAFCGPQERVCCFSSELKWMQKNKKKTLHFSNSASMNLWRKREIFPHFLNVSAGWSSFTQWQNSYRFTRGLLQENCITPPCRTLFGQTTSYQSTTLWNLLPPHVKATPELKKFVYMTKYWLKKNPRCDHS